MSAKEYAQHKVTEYTILKKAALKVEDWRMAEYYDTLIISEKLKKLNMELVNQQRKQK